MSKKANRLEKFFSPITDQTPKRRRSKSSPEEINCEKEKNIKLRRGEKMDLTIENISSLLDTKFEVFRSLLPTKNDFKTLETKIDALVAENNGLKREIQEMKLRENKINDTLEILINRNKVRNLVFRGLENDRSKNSMETVEEICGKVLGVENAQVSRVSELGKESIKKVVIAEFKNEDATYDILRNSSKLKGSGIVIHRDLSTRTRRKKRCLLLVRKKIMELDSQAKIKMRDTCFVFKDKRFGWDVEEGLLCEGKDGSIILKQLIGNSFTEDVERNLKKILEVDKQYKQSRVEPSTNFLK